MRHLQVQTNFCEETGETKKLKKRVHLELKYASEKKYLEMQTAKPQERTTKNI